MASRRRPPPLKWQPLASPTPRVLNFPVRRRGQESRKMKQRGTTTTKRLEALFDEEKVFGKEELPVYRVPIVLLNAGGGERGRKKEEGTEEEVAGVEVEMLRAECRFLRMERELASKKVKRNRARMERILRSAIQTLVSVKDGVAAEIGDGGFLCQMLDEEIEAIRSRLVDLQKMTGGTKLVFDAAHRSCSSSSNVDDQACSSVENGFGLDGGNQIVPRQIQEMAEASLCMPVQTGSESLGRSSRFTDVTLRSRKMEGLSSGTLSERMEEAKGSRPMTKVDSSAASSTSTPWRWRIEMPHLDLASYSIQQAYQEGVAGRCRAVVRRITEQVRIETEQWSQMQEMLDKVRDEMEQWQASRNKWEWQALDFKNQTESLNITVEEWQQKALLAETKVNDLQSQLQVLQEELEILRREQARTNNIPIFTSSTDTKSETEKRVLICELRENHIAASSDSKRRRNVVSTEEMRKQYSVSTKKLEAPKRSPFRDIGNSSSLMRQITKVVFPGDR